MWTGLILTLYHASILDATGEHHMWGNKPLFGNYIKNRNYFCNLNLNRLNETHEFQ